MADTATPQLSPCTTLPMDTTALNLGQLTHHRFQPGFPPSIATGLCKMSACKFWLILRGTFCVTLCHVRDVTG